MTNLQETKQFLTKKEEKRLESLENEAIAIGNTMLQSALQMGKILNEIRENGYFAKKRRNSNIPPFADFSEYAKHRFKKGKTSAYNYIHVYVLQIELDKLGIDINEFGNFKNAFELYQQIKEIKKVNSLAPMLNEIIRKGIKVIQNITPTDEVGEMLITPEIIDLTFGTISNIASNGAFEIDGEQIPITLSQIAVDQEVSQKLYERIQTRNDRLSEKIEIQKKSLRKIKNVTPKEYSKNKDIKEVFLICPIHKKSSGRFLLKGGVKMDCGCGAIIYSTKENTILIWESNEDMEIYNE